MDPKGKRILIVATHGPEAPDLCAAPFFFAQKAAHLGGRVTVCFILHSALLLKPGVAEAICGKEGGVSVRRFMDLALKSGVEFSACDAALKMNNMTPEEMIEEVEQLVGPNYLITEGLEADLVLTL